MFEGACRVIRLVRAIRRGWIKLHKEAAQQEDQPYLMWADDGQVCPVSYEEQRYEDTIHPFNLLWLLACLLGVTQQARLMQDHSNIAGTIQLFPVYSPRSW